MAINATSAVTRTIEQHGQTARAPFGALGLAQNVRWFLAAVAAASAHVAAGAALAPATHAAFVATAHAAATGFAAARLTAAAHAAAAGFAAAALLEFELDHAVHLRSKGGLLAHFFCAKRRRNMINLARRRRRR